MWIIVQQKLSKKNLLLGFFPETYFVLNTIVYFQNIKKYA